MKKWQSRKSSCKGGENLEEDLQHVLTSMRKCVWRKEKDATTRIWAETSKEEERRRSFILVLVPGSLF